MTFLLRNEISDPLYFPPASAASAWVEHAPFAMWLVTKLKPRRIVELGTHSGFSYFAMCQAVQEAGLDTDCFAVDTWVGEEHAGFYSEEVFDNVRRENQKYQDFSTLLRKTFEEALDDVEDGTVDLLHVDGRHFYDDVKQDFEGWIPKLSSRAVVLFHDTVVQQRGFGVYKYWDELSDKYPSFNFTHCHGLGVLFHGSDISPEMGELIAASRANDGPGEVERFFEEVGSTISTRQERAHNRLNAEALLARSRLQEIDALKADIAFLSSQLVNARKQPFKQLRRLIVYNTLRMLSKASPPLPARRTKRFERSAAKRDPVRCGIAHVDSSLGYAELLDHWQEQREAVADRTALRAKELSDGVKFSIVVRVQNPDPALLQGMIDSVIKQSHTNWQLCIADDGSSDAAVLNALSRAAESDKRINIVTLEPHGPVGQAVNKAIEIAQGDFITVISQADVLDRDALLHIADSIDHHPEAKIVYTDEDRIRADGSRMEPHFKPDWNRELFYAHNYVANLCVFSSELVKTIGGLRVGHEGPQDHDLMLRSLAHVSDTQIQHVPKVLYSARGAPLAEDAHPQAWRAGAQAVADALQVHCGQPVDVDLGPYPFTYLPQWPLDGSPSVTIVIPTRDRLDITRVAVNSILEKTDYKNFEIVIVDNGSVEPETLAWFDEISKSRQVSVLRDDGPFNYSALNNRAVKQSDSDLIALVNNDIEVISPGWLREMVSLANRPDGGCVGAKLYYPDNTIQHAGVVVGLGRTAGHVFSNLDRSDAGYFSRLMLRQEYSAVTAACLVVRRSVYEAVGGLNEENLTVAFNDIDLCLKVKAAGYRNFWTPLAEMYHFESASRQAENTPAKLARFRKESQYMIDTWQTNSMEDPAYNPNLTKNFSDFSFGPARW